MAICNPIVISGENHLNVVEPLVYWQLNGNTNLDVMVQPNSRVTLVLDLNACRSVQFHAMVQPDSILDVALVSMKDQSIDQHYRITLQNGATTNIRSCFLGNAKKTMKMEIIHHGLSTVSTMEHYGLINTANDFKIEAIGTIEKEADNTQCRQALRALTFSDHDHVTMVPSLYIDNYNCSASHSTSIGAMSPKQLYYLQSRGLTMESITLLLAKGYITPVLELISDEELKTQLREEIEKVVIDACLTKLQSEAISR